MMYPRVNQNIVIEIKNEDLTYRSIVAEVGESEILIAFPMDRNSIGKLLDGVKVDIIYTVEENKYKFKTEILGRKFDKMPLFRILKPLEKDIIKIQDRENFRVRTNLSVLLVDHEVHTLNISAGGVLIACDLDIELVEGQEITGTLRIPHSQSNKNEPLPFQGMIKRITLTEEQEKKQVAIEFTEVHKRDQMKITQFCFEKQRQLRLKEKGRR